MGCKISTMLKTGSEVVELAMLKGLNSFQLASVQGGVKHSWCTALANHLGVIGEARSCP